MKNEINLTEYEKEYYTEIKKCKITKSDLKKLGVSDKTFAAEKCLFDAFGDEIYESFDGEVLTGKKKVVKLSDEEKSLGSELEMIFNKIDKNKFDDEVDEILRKVNDWWKKICFWWVTIMI